MVKHKKQARTFMPEIIAPGTGLSPATNKSVIPFNNVHTIWDVLTGDKYKLPGGGGDWSDGEEAQPHSYKPDGDQYKRVERDLEIFKNLSTFPQNISEEWKVKVRGGYKLFPSLESAQRYRRKMQDKGIDIKWITRTKTASVESSKIVDDALEKTFMIESINFNEQTKETGAAFCIAPNTFLTCAHVVKTYNKNTESHLDFSKYRGTVKVTIINNGKKVQANVVAFDGVNDLAIITANIPCKSFAFSNKELNIGEEIFAIGSPHGFDNNAFFGYISSTDRKIYFHQGAPDYMFVDLSIFPGNSGGPVVNRQDGKLVGIVTAIVAPNADYGLNATLPVKYIESFCTKNGIKITK